jgi:hypothetical protein
MDGQYLNRKEEIIRFLQDWIEKMINEKLWEKYVDLHIDEIDISFKENKTWIEEKFISF